MSPGALSRPKLIGTAILVLVIFCATDERNATRPQILTAATIGLTVTIIISLIGPLTMAVLESGARSGAANFFVNRRLGRASPLPPTAWAG